MLVVNKRETWEGFLRVCMLGTCTLLYILLVWLREGSDFALVKSFLARHLVEFLMV
jgi:hypothetical protein